MNQSPKLKNEVDLCLPQLNYTTQWERFPPNRLRLVYYWKGMDAERDVNKGGNKNIN